MDEERGPQFEERTLDIKGRCCKFRSLMSKTAGARSGQVVHDWIHLSFNSGIKEHKTDQGGQCTSQVRLEAPKRFCSEIYNTVETNTAASVSGLLGLLLMRISTLALFDYRRCCWLQLRSMESVTGTKFGQKCQGGAMLSAEIGKYVNCSSSAFKFITQSQGATCFTNMFDLLKPVSP